MPASVKYGYQGALCDGFPIIRIQTADSRTPSASSATTWRGSDAATMCAASAKEGIHCGINMREVEVLALARIDPLFSAE